jgi:selenocysteine-specific elongation factor
VHVVATAGHVDHGKSTLVLALTGTDPDRFAEEKERGLTIDLGFASTKLPSGRGMSIVDVPGHVRFLKNMLAGVGAVDAAMFVVAATEGWKPQSEEHLRILELLGLDHGLVVLTKADLVDDELAELAQLDIEDHVAGTFLEDAPVILVDSLSGTGLDDLQLALDDLLDTTPTAADNGRPRLWIDRAFSAKGSGTVVTGTMTGGRVRVEDELVLLPADVKVRVRAIQSLHAQRTKVGPGNRVALNLGGIAWNDVQRGNVLVREGQWHQTSVFDASLTVLDTVAHEVSRRGAHAVYLGAGEFPVRMRILGPAALEAGQAGHVRVHLPVALPLLPGDRFILRESGRVETIGGGEILDVDPVMRASRARPDRSVDRVITERGFVEAAQLERLTGTRREPNIGKWVCSPETLEAMTAALQEQVDAAGPMGFDTAGLDDLHRAVLASIPGIAVDGGRARAVAQADPLANHDFVERLADAPFAPPDPEGVDRAELRELVRRGEVIEEDGIYFAASAIDAAAGEAAALLAVGDGFTVAEFRERLGTTRKYALPLLARLDRTGVTRRRDDVRIAGPRIPNPPS